MSELQSGLLAIGALVVVGVLIYNRVQERRAKRDAERAFGSGHDDILLRPPGAKPGAQLDLELPVVTAGDYGVEVVMTMAPDYGIVQLLLDGQKLGEPIDLFNNPEVITTGVVTFDHRPLTAGPHKLSVQLIGANPNAIKNYMFGLDYVRLVPVAEK